MFSQEVPDFASQFASINLLESKPLKGLRVGVIRETLDEGVDIGVISAIRGAASHLEELGCSVTEVYFCYLYSLQPLSTQTPLVHSISVCISFSCLYNLL